VTTTPDNPRQSRWITLPGDPPQLKRWLAGRQAEANPETALPPDWPQEPS
jgi:hypothetical protein